MNQPDPPAYPALETRLSARIARLVREPGRAMKRIPKLAQWLRRPRRSLPHGLFTSAFFWAGDDTRLRLHRDANLASRGYWPAALWLLYQAMLAARWQRHYAVGATDRAVAQFGSFVEEKEGITCSEQRRRVLELTRRYCMLPNEIYEFRLYRDPERALDFIFSWEAMGFHKMMNARRSTDEARNSTHFDGLADKAHFAKRALEENLPCVPTLRVLTTTADISPETLAQLHTDGVFLKARSGYQGQGALHLRKQNGILNGVLLDGTPLKGIAEIEAALSSMLARDHVVVQPMLQNHPLLAPSASPENVIIIRLMTRCVQTDVEVISAYLRVPRIVSRPGHAQRRLDIVAGIELSTGRIFRNNDSQLSFFSEGRRLENHVFGLLGDTTNIPFWAEICSHSKRAQNAFPAFWGIGWDWVVTENGPVLLEGNVYWGMRKAQEVAGGFMRFVNP